MPVGSQWRDVFSNWCRRFALSEAQLCVLLLRRHAVNAYCFRRFAVGVYRLFCVPFPCRAPLPWTDFFIDRLFTCPCRDLDPYTVVKSPATQRKASYSPSPPPPRFSAFPLAYPCRYQCYGHSPCLYHRVPASLKPAAKARCPSQPP